MKFSKSIYVTVLTLVLSFSSFAQSTEFTTTRNLVFNQSSKTKSVDVKIPKAIEALSIEIRCGIKKGNVTIQIFDPSGVKQGEFSVENTEESEEEQSLLSMMRENVVGEINKYIKKPVSGTWVIKFLPENATGHVEMRSSQHTI